MRTLELKPTRQRLQNHQAAQRQFDRRGVNRAGAVKPTFRRPLEHCARRHDWKLVSKRQCCAGFNDPDLVRRNRIAGASAEVLDGVVANHGWCA